MAKIPHETDAGDAFFHWDGPLPAPDFVMVPKLVHQRILRHLSGAEFKVFYALLARAYEWGAGDAELSLAQIVTMAGVGRGSVQRAIATLTERGLLTVHHHISTEHGDEANTYRLLVTDDPRYIDRHPVTKMGMGVPKTGKAPTHHGDGSRARSLSSKETDQEGATRTSKYTRGRYAVCPDEPLFNAKGGCMICSLAAGQHTAECPYHPANRKDTAP